MPPVAPERVTAVYRGDRLVLVFWDEPGELASPIRESEVPAVADTFVSGRIVRLESQADLLAQLASSKDARDFSARLTSSGYTLRPTPADALRWAL